MPTKLVFEDGKASVQPDLDHHYVKVVRDIVATQIENVTKLTEFEDGLLLAIHRLLDLYILKYRFGDADARDHSKIKELFDQLYDMPGASVGFYRKKWQDFSDEFIN